MPRGPNPYFAPSGQYEGIAQSINNLGQAFLAGNDPLRKAQGEQAAWGARTSMEEVKDSMAAREGRQELGNFFSNYDPETYAPQQVIGQAVASNAYNPDDLGQLMLVAAGNLQGMSDEQKAGALLGTGETLGENEFVSVGDREGGRQSNFQNDMAIQRMEEQAETDRDLASAFTLSSGQTRFGPDGQVIASSPGEANSGTGQAVMYEMQDGSMQPGMFNNRQGYQNNAGRPMDMSGVSNVVRIGQPQGSNDEIGLGTKATNNEEGRLLGAREGLDFIGRVREVAQDPRNFGVTGALRGTVQDAIQQGDALAQYMGTEGRDIQENIARSGYDISLENFDPDLPKLDMMQNLLAYKMASTLAQQEGRGLSDNDFRRFQEMFSGQGMLSNQRDFLSRLEMAESLLQDAGSRAGDNLGRQFEAPGGQGPAPQPQTQPQRPQPEAGPRPGMVEDGYRFRGGDPGNPENWEAVE